jgi:threonine dehydratase/predicted transcriptional regulator
MTSNKFNVISINQQKVLGFLEGRESATTGEISKNLDIPRPTAKQILQRLLDLKLIKRQGLGRGAYYFLQQKDEIYDSKGEKLVTVYKGLNSFKTMFKEIQSSLKAGDFYWSFAFKNEYYDQELGKFLLDFHRNLTGKKVDDRTVAMPGVREVILDNYRTIPALKIRFTSKEVPTGMIVLKDRVVNLVWGKAPIAIMIKSSVISEKYQDFFLDTWNSSLVNELQYEEVIFKPGNSPIVVPRNTIYGAEKLLIKDETQNPTHTFKDRLAYEMIRPLLEEVRQGRVPKPMTFGSISYGNTAKAMGYYVNVLNKMVGKEVARAVVFVPPSIEKKTFGPDTEGSTFPATTMLEDIKKTCIIVPIDLSLKIYRAKDLEDLARKHNQVIGQFVDITEGLDRPAYVNIIIEAIEQQLRFSPDYAIVPFGAGILCNEIIDYVNEHKLKTKVIPVSSGDPNTIAVMLYGPIWVDTVKLLKDGKAYTRHEPFDRKGRPRSKYIVYHVGDDDLRDAMKELKKNKIHSEASGASGIALLKHLKKIDPSFDKAKHSVLVINTGDGLLNYK